MTELKMISPMLDDFEVGGPISDHDGVRCYPAMRKNSDEKYIVKVISVPASQTKLDALLLTGAYSSKEAALVYFEELANEIADEKRILDNLAQLEGFLPYADIQIAPKDDGTGFDIYLLSEYRLTLERHIAKNSLTQLAAVNLGLDLCAALTVCRRSGYLCVDVKPSNIMLTGENEFCLGDLGFVKLSALQYASLPDKYRSRYTAPEVEDAFSALNETLDIYAAGLVLYQVFNGGVLPFETEVAPSQEFAAPIYADAEMAEIILKACHPDPNERWQDPVQMGQAIVSYMQKNGVNDTPLSAEAFGLHEEVEEVSEAVSEETVAETETNLVDVDAAITESSVDEEIQDVAAEPEIVFVEQTSGAPAQAIIPEFDDAQPATESIVEPSAEPVIAPIVDEISAAINGTEEDTPTEEATETPQDEECTVLEEALTAEVESTVEELPEEMIDEDTDTEKTVDAEAEEELNIDYSEVSDEVSDMLNQIDELAAHQVPEPAVAPEPIEVKLPDPLPEATEEETTSDVSEAQDVLTADADAPQETEEDPKDDIPEELPYVPKKKRTGLKWCIALLVIIGLLVGGFYFYQEYYLQPIHSLELTGVEDRLQVQLSADIDETYLTVICADAHGNKIPAPVVGGSAVFSGLMPDTAYTVTVEVEGFHKLTGATSKVYSTPMQTKIAQVSIVTGAENGSVILSFAVEGPDSDQWNVIYSADGEAERVTTFPSHMVTLTGLTVGKEYSFRLEPVDDVYLSGEAEISYVVKDVVYAENLHVTACTGGILSAQWEAPEGVTVEKWSVRCYNDAGYDETIVTEETTVTFENIDDTSGYTLDVTAADMSVNRRAIVSPNSVTVTEFSVDASNANMLQLSWFSNREDVSGGWSVQYTVDGVNAASSIQVDEAVAQVPVVPGGNYQFTLLDGAGNPVLGGPFTHTQEAANDFDGFSVTSSDLTVRLCKTPASSGWSYKDLEDEDYVNSFSLGQKFSAVIALSGSVERSDEDVLITYTIHNENGELVCFSHETQTWRSMWYENYCELDVSAMPTDLGTYDLTLFFNGQTVGTQKFEITA